MNHSSSVTSRPSGHWLTVMTCIVCKRTSEHPPVYECDMHHVTCNSCFQKLTNKVCQACNSKELKERLVHQDFLDKLKITPGIGKPNRYQTKPSINFTDFNNPELPDTNTENMTVEKLFQLPNEQIKNLFEITRLERQVKSNKNKWNNKFRRFRTDHSSNSDETYEKLNNLNHMKVYSTSASGDGENSSKSSCSCGSLLNNEQEKSNKPIVCPHHPCGKIITVSSFDEHFIREHHNLEYKQIEYGESYCTQYDVGEIEFNKTFCIAAIALRKQTGCRHNFWLLISGSPELRKRKAYVLLWLLTNSDEAFNCTLEVASLRENINCSVCCPVNKISDSFNIFDVAYRLNCLNLSYGTVCNLLRDGPQIKITVEVH